MAPVTMPVLVVGLITCLLLEKTKIFGYGAQMPPRVRDILVDYDQTEAAKRTDLDVARLVIQAISAVVLILVWVSMWPRSGSSA